MNSKLYLSKEQTRELLDSKDRFGQLFRFDIGDIIVISRPLLISESELISVFSDQLYDNIMEDWIFEKTLVYCNKNVDKLPAGIIPSVVAKILTNSNIKNEDEFNKSVLNNRAKVDTLQNVIEGVIGRAYPSLDPNDIKNMTQYQQIILFAKAENITGTKIDIGGKSKGKRKRPVPVQEGYSAIDIVSKEAADIPDFEKDNQGMK